MAFEGLTEKLNATFKRLRGKGRLTEADVKEAMREVRLALLEADVGYKVVKDFIATVTERSVGTDVLDSLTPAQQVIKIVNEELTALMGGSNAKIAMANNGPTVVMMVGLQGAGKTTTTAKLAGLMRRQYTKRPLLAACDVYRPAAIEQLKVVGGQMELPVFEQGQGDPVKIAENAGISRQGVRDVIVRAEATMQEVEDKTGIIKRFEAQRPHLEAIEAAAAEIQTLNYRQYEDPRLSELTELITQKIAALKD